MPLESINVSEAMAGDEIKSKLTYLNGTTFGDNWTLLIVALSEDSVAESSCSV